MGYVFDPLVLHAAAAKRAGLPHEEMVRLLIDDLAQLYPGHITTKQDWILSIAGGAMGIMTVLHGSLSEYIIIFGTPVGTEGFSGRYRLDIHDFMLAGEMWTYTEEDFRERVIYRPGDPALLRRREVKGFRLSEDTWMLEYGRGFVPSALPFGLSGAVLSLDLKTIWKTLWIYGQLVVKELLHGKI